MSKVELESYPNRPSNDDWHKDFGCPECGWIHPDDNDKYILKPGKLFSKRKKCFIIQNYWIECKDKSGRYEENKEVTKEIKEKIYPILENYSEGYNWSVGAKCADWDETHRCPNCDKEYTISDGYP